MLSQLLQKHEIKDKNVKRNYGSMISKKNYYFGLNELDILMKTYSNELECKSLQEDLCEENYISFYGDIDLYCTKDEISRMFTDDLSEDEYELYTFDDLMIFYKTIILVLIENIENIDDNQLDFIVQTKEIRFDSEKHVYKHGIHWNIPKLFLSKISIKTVITKIINELKGTTCFETILRHTNLNMETIVDTNASCSAPRLMYKSSKDLNINNVFIPEYIFCWDSINKQIKYQHEFTLDEWFLKQTIYSYKNDEFIQILDKSNLEEVKTRVLSSFVYGRDMFIRNLIKTDSNVPICDVYDIYDDESGDICSEDIEKLNKIMKIIPDSFAERGNSGWYKVGMCIYSVTNGCKHRGLSLFEEFSKRKLDIFEEDVNCCKNRWLTYHKYKVSSKFALNILAKIIKNKTHDYDNELYSILYGRENIDYELRNINLNSNLKLAEIYLQITDRITISTSRNVVSTTTKTLRFSYLKGLRYVEDKAYDLHTDIRVVLTKKTNDMIHKMNKYIKALKNQKDIGKIYKEISFENIEDLEDTEFDEDTLKLYEYQLRVLCNLRDKCDNSSWLESIVKGVEMKQFNHEFLNVVNWNDMQYACANGILNLDTCRFEEDVPENNTLYYSPCRYREELNEDHEDVKEYREYMRQIFPIEEERDHKRWIYAKSLIGFNVNETMTFNLGSGSNGKSVDMDIQSKLHGIEKYNFGVSVPTNILYSLPTSTDPAIISCKGKRDAFIDESKTDEPICLVRLKNLIGSSGSEVRGLYEDPSFLRIKCNWTMYTNNMIPLWNLDAAGMRRIGDIFMYRSIFSAVAPEDPSEQRQKNHYFADVKYKNEAHLRKMAEVRLWDSFNVAIERKRLYPETWLKQDFGPESLRDTKEKIKLELLPIYIFINVKYEFTNVETDEIKWSNLYSLYQTWYTEKYGRGKDKVKPPQSVTYLLEDISLCLKKGICQRYIDIQNDKIWKGWKENTRLI